MFFVVQTFKPDCHNSTGANDLKEYDFCFEAKGQLIWNGAMRGMEVEE